MRFGAIDLGGTWIRVTRDGDADDGARGFTRPTPSEPEALRRELARIGAELSRCDHIGLATAPVLSPTGQILKWGARPSLVGFEVLQALALEPARVSVFDDVSAAAWAEHCFLRAEMEEPPQCTALILVGTGLGAGLVVADRLWSGVHGQAMDLGHAPLANDLEAPCPCGARGCLQLELSGQALESRLTAQGGDPASYRTALAASEPWAVDIVRQLEAPLERAMRAVRAFVDPAVLSIGGGALGPPAVLQDLVSRLAPTVRPARLRAAAPDGWSGAIGALQLARGARGRADPAAVQGCG